MPLPSYLQPITDPEVRVIVCPECGGDAGWEPEQPHQSWLECRECDGEGSIEIVVEPITAEDL